MVVVVAWRGVARGVIIDCVLRRVRLFFVCFAVYFCVFAFLLCVSLMMRRAKMCVCFVFVLCVCAMIDSSNIAAAIFLCKQQTFYFSYGSGLSFR